MLGQKPYTTVNRGFHKNIAYVTYVAEQTVHSVPR